MIRKTILLTSLAWISVFASCASGEIIKTWIITDKGLEHNTSSVQELQTFALSIGYRCYSKEDDMAWRDRMVELDACCNAPTAVK